MQLGKDKCFTTKCFFRYLKKGLTDKRIANKSLFYRLKVILKGFWPGSYHIYKSSGFPLDNFLSDYKRIVKLSLLNRPNLYILADKLVFENFYSNSLKSLGLIEGGYILQWEENSSTTMEAFINKFPGNRRLFCKPRRGGGGGGAYTIEFNGENYLMNGKEKSLQEILIKSRNFHNYLIYDCCKQRGFSNDIFPETLNTIRLLSVIDPQSKQPIIIRALHRFGTSSSIPVDNWSSGGICCNIDIETGRLSRGVIFPKNGKLKWYDCHPDTGKKLEGTFIPYWDKIIELTLKIHRQVPYLTYIGWDLALDNDEIIIIEGNANSGVDGFQAHEPLLINEVFSDFLKKSRYNCA